jgi:hypothetical protein
MTRRAFFFLPVVLLMVLPPSGNAWETAGSGIFYTMEDLADSSHGAVTTADSVKFVIAEFITIRTSDTLSIDPGDSLCFQKVSPVIVLKINGVLLAQGTAPDPIVFTSNEPSPDTSNWGRIEFEDDPPGSIFEHCHISFAATGITCDSSSLDTIRQVIITSVGSNGMSLSNSSPTIENCTITGFDGSGIVCTGNSQPLVGGSLAASNTFYNALPPTGFTFKNFTSNTITATHNNWGIEDYVYIDSIIVDDDENGAYGEVVFVPLYDIVPPAAITDLTASPADTGIALSWSAVTADTAGSAEHLNRYVIYRDTTASFSPSWDDSIGTTASTVFTDSSAATGNVAVNSFYRVLAVDDAGNPGGNSNGVGEYDFALGATTGTDYTWVAFCLSDTGLAMASDLEAHIENNSSPAVDCYTVSRWNATSQTYIIYTTIPIPQGDFALQPGTAYRVETDTSAVWTLTGAVPDGDSVAFQLEATTGTDYTWISLPLQLDTLSLTSDLETHIENNSSPAVDCYTVSQWNAASQTYTIYSTIPVPTGDFAVRAGRPYRVETDTSAVWPSP